LLCYATVLYSVLRSPLISLRNGPPSSSPPRFTNTNQSRAPVKPPKKRKANKARRNLSSISPAPFVYPYSKYSTLHPNSIAPQQIVVVALALVVVDLQSGKTSIAYSHLLPIRYLSTLASCDHSSLYSYTPLSQRVCFPTRNGRPKLPDHSHHLSTQPTSCS
jgi:hypothetical protein